jgi:hypothetical protein
MRRETTDGFGVGFTVAFVADECGLAWVMAGRRQANNTRPAPHAFHPVCKVNTPPEAKPPVKKSAIGAER